MTDYCRKATAAEGALRIIAGDLTQTVLDVQRVHQASPVAAAAMGRLVTAVAILATDFQDSTRVIAELEGDGPMGRVVAEVIDGHKIRARADHPQVELPLRDDGKLAVGQAVGRKGLFTVTREDFAGTVYQGQVALVSGEVGQDFAQYYTLSEQVATAVAVGVLVGVQGEVVAAGGLVIQALPGSTGYVDDIVQRLPRLERISHRLAEGERAEQLAQDVITSPLRWFEQEPMYYGCVCSETRSLEILSSLPRAELEALIEDRGAEVVCHYCHNSYRFSQEQIEKLLEQSRH